MPDERTERVARNESRFRDINERLGQDLAKLPAPPEIVPFVCECGQSECTGVVEMSIREYELVRASGRRFALLPGHDIPGTEVVVERNDRYFVVEKLGEGGEITEATYARSRRNRSG